MVRAQMRMELYGALLEGKFNQHIRYKDTMDAFVAKDHMEGQISEESAMRLFQMWKKSQLAGRGRIGIGGK